MLEFANFDKTIRIQLLEDCRVLYSINQKQKEAQLIKLALGVYFLDISSTELQNASEIQFQLLGHSQLNEKKFTLRKAP